MIDFRTEPSAYRHWRVSFAGPVATLAMDVDENGGLVPGYELKLNSYDLGVDIELNDAVNRLRFEHPEVKCVIVTSGKERVFCAGANIRMLGLSSHPFKVNFCKFTNETRNAIEDATLNSDQYYMTAIGGAVRGRRLRTRARDRLYNDGGRRLDQRLAAGGRTARRAAGHRRSDAAGR